MKKEIKKKIIIVEDDVRLAALIKDYLEAEGFELFVEHNGARATDLILEEQPDMVILDMMLPGKDGLSICREIRSAYRGHILFLTARKDDMDQVAGLEIGADDYVKKPIEPRVLLARIRALFRRYSPFGDNESAVSGQNPLKRMEFDSLSIDSSRREVRLNNEIIQMSTGEFELLWLLASRAGEVLDRDFLYTTLKGFSYDGMDRSMDLLVSKLRKKIKDDPESPARIKTVWGSGYLFVKDAW